MKKGRETGRKKVGEEERRKEGKGRKGKEPQQKVATKLREEKNYT